MKAKGTDGSEDTGMESWRAEIDKCDQQIIELLARRFELVKKIGKYKATYNLPVMDEERETELLSDRERLASRTGNYSAEGIFRLILEESRRVQERMKEDRDKRR